MSYAQAYSESSGGLKVGMRDTRSYAKNCNSMRDSSLVSGNLSTVTTRGPSSRVCVSCHRMSMSNSHGSK